MAVTATNAFNGPYTADGVTTTFPFTFIAASPEEVAVARVGSDGDFVEIAGYTVTLTDTGGSVAFGAAPVAGDPLYIVSAPSLEQQITFANQGQWSPTTMNAALDRAAIRDIVLQRQLDQAIAAPVGEVTAFLPDAATRAGMFLVFDAGGNPTVTANASGADTALRTDLAAQGGSALSGYRPSWAGAITRTVQDKLRDLPNLYDLIAPANRNTGYNATTEINAALATGEVFVLPKAEVRGAGPFVATAHNAGFIGQGQSSVISSTHATNDIFQIGDGSNEIRGLLFRDFRVWSTVTKTGGYVFNGRYIAYSRFEDILCGSVRDYSDSGSTHKLYKGYAFNGFAQCAVEGGETVTANDCVTINGKAAQTWGYELYFDGGMRLFNSAGKAFYLGGSAGGVRLGALDVSLCQYGFYCDTALTGENNRELFLSSLCSIDSCTNWGGFIDNNGLSLLRAPGGWIAGCGQPTGAGGLKLATGAGTKVDAPGIRIYGNYGDGAELNSGDVNLSGSQIDTNGRLAGGGHGIRALSGISRLVIDGADIRSNGNATLGRAVYVGSGVDNYTITDNDLTGNGQSGAPLEFQGGLTLGATKKVRGNRGFRTEGANQATITTGNTTVTVTHGMDHAPNYPQLTNIGHGTDAWVQNLNATTFQIAIGSAAGSDIAFQWTMSGER